MPSPYSTGRYGVRYGSTTASSGYRSGISRSAQGADAFLALSKRLKEAGDKAVRNELHKAVRAAGRPVLPKIKAAALKDLPKAGGLNERIAKKPVRAQTRTGATTAGLRIAGTKVDPRINEGRVWHPVFGRKGKAKNGGKNSVVQDVPSARGYFDETIRGQAPQMREDITKVLVDFAQRLARPL